jgi:virulence-associated protein VagC
MADTAKLIVTGRSQAVRLPREYRFEGQEVFIRRDPVSGDESWTLQELFDPASNASR